MSFQSRRPPDRLVGILGRESLSGQNPQSTAAICRIVEAEAPFYEDLRGTLDLRRLFAGLGGLDQVGRDSPLGQGLPDPFLPPACEFPLVPREFDGETLVVEDQRFLETPDEVGNFVVTGSPVDEPIANLCSRAFLPGQHPEGAGEELFDLDPGQAACCSSSSPSTAGVSVASTTTESPLEIPTASRIRRSSSPESSAFSARNCFEFALP